MKPTKKFTISQTEAIMSTGCIQHYLITELGAAADGRINHLYGDKLVKEVMAALRKKKQTERNKQMVVLTNFYARLYKESTVMDAMSHPVTGKPCSPHQWHEAMEGILER